MLFLCVRTNKINTKTLPTTQQSWGTTGGASQKSLKSVDMLEGPFRNAEFFGWGAYAI